MSSTFSGGGLPSGTTAAESYANPYSTLSSANSIDWARSLPITSRLSSSSSGAPAPQPPQQRHVLVGGVVGRDADEATDREVVEAVLQRALTVALVDRAALGLVRLEQRRRRVAGEDRPELPAQVLRVVDRARQPETTGRRVAMGGVSEQEYAPDLEALREDGLERPARDLVDLHGQVADAEGAARVGLDLFVGLRDVGGVVEVNDPFLGVGAPALWTHRDDHRKDPALRRVDPADQDVRVGRPLGEVCADVERRLMGDHAEPLVADADELRDTAAAVGA